VHVSSSTFQPAVVGDLRHLPLIRKLSSLAYVHCCAAPPLQVRTSAAVPIREESCGSSRHMPPTPSRTDPVRPVPGARLTVQVNVAEAAASRLSAAFTVR